jgi:small subunit ribosomal protein S8
MRHDLLADTLSMITNAIKVGKKKCVVKPTSKFIVKVIDLFKKEGFIDNYVFTENIRGGELLIMLNDKLNKCLAIKPRFASKTDELEKFEKRFLPSKDFGFLVISTPKGLMTHIEAKEKKYGGKLIAYIY